MFERSEAMKQHAVRDASPGYRSASVNTASDDVPPGYKRTEVGVIPDDWAVRKIRDLAQIRRGASPRPIADPEWFDVKSDIGWLRISDVAREGKYIRTTDQSLSTPGVSRSRLVRPGSVIMSMAATVGRPAINHKTVCIHDGFVAFDKPSLSPEFFYYLLLAIEDKWAERGQTGSQINLNTHLIGSTPVPLPEIPDEQRAIATALSGADALIESLDRLIAKKRAIKQATMQQLLTGQTRLPGFTGKWEKKRLGKHVTFLKTGTNSRSELSDHGSVAYLHYGDIHVGTSVRLNPNTVTMPRIEISKVRRLDQLEPGDLVFVDASEDLEGVGKCVEIAGVPTSGMVAGLHTIAARFDKAVLADGFKAYLQFCPVFIGTLRRLAAGTKVLATNRQHIANVEMYLPDVEEQEAIASVLSDMDAEVEALERRHEKACQIKQGMMQQLLTGRVRLIEAAISQ